MRVFQFLATSVRPLRKEPVEAMGSIPTPRQGRRLTPDDSIRMFEFDHNHKQMKQNRRFPSFNSPIFQGVRHVQPSHPFHCILLSRPS